MNYISRTWTQLADLWWLHTKLTWWNNTYKILRYIYIVCTIKKPENETIIEIRYIDPLGLFGCIIIIIILCLSEHIAFLCALSFFACWSKVCDST